MKILHHFDDDGRCAAAVVRLKLSNGNLCKPSDCIEYFHGQQNLLDRIHSWDLKPNEEVYIVDLAMDDVIFGVMKHLISKECKIIHIDHHQSTIDWFLSSSDEDSNILFDNNLINFYQTEYSGCMLSLIYSYMSTQERKRPMTTKFTVSDNRDSIIINDNNRHHVPDIVRYIDDNDIWRHHDDNTKYFSLGFSMVDDKTPCSYIWNMIDDYGTGLAIKDIIDQGKLLYDYQSHINANIMKSSFMTKLDGIDCLAVNAPIGNSRLFGDKFDEVPFVCKFSYNGSNNKWMYSLYCSDKYDPLKQIDLSKIAKFYGGGGHKHAAGFLLDYNLFEKKKK